MQADSRLRWARLRRPPFAEQADGPETYQHHRLPLGRHSDVLCRYLKRCAIAGIDAASM
jgi:hypothetical protein